MNLNPESRPQERATPEVLIKSMARRRRVAVDSGQTEAEVTKLMGAYTAVGPGRCPNQFLKARSPDLWGLLRRDDR